MTYRTLAALGSSFAAGPGLEPVDDAAAQRSQRNYPHLLAEMLGAGLRDLTVSGATTSTILREPQTGLTGERFAPQIEGLPHDADLVTVTAGGNDLGFLGRMILAAVRRVSPEHPLVSMLAREVPDVLAEPGADDVERTTAGLVDIVDETRRRVPAARVVLVDYLTVIDAVPNEATTRLFSGDEHRALVQTQAALEHAFRRASDRAGADLVAVSAASRAHGLGGHKPWVAGLRLESVGGIAGSFHPTAAGMRFVAERVAAHLGR